MEGKGQKRIFRAYSPRFSKNSIYRINFPLQSYLLPRNPSKHLLYTTFPSQSKQQVAKPYIYFSKTFVVFFHDDFYQIKLGIHIFLGTLNPVDYFKKLSDTSNLFLKETTKTNKSCYVM